MTQIRLARETDVSDCIKFDHVASRSVIRSKIGSKEIVLAQSISGVVGYLRLEYLWSRIPYIGLIIVDEKLRGKGIGREMLRFLETFLRKHGHKLLLSSSQANEPRPQQWHRRIGFEECGVIAGINDGGIGEVFFRKRLRA